MFHPHARKAIVALVLLPLILNFTAAAEPHAGTRVVLVLDRSKSMLQDNRLTRLLDGAAALIVSLPEGSEIAVVVFEHQAEVLIPLVRLTDASRAELLNQLNVAARGGTNIVDGVTTALDLLGVGGGVLVVLSDGIPTANDGQPLAEAVWRPATEQLARRSRQQGVVMHTLGLGPDVQADPLLRQLAAGTGGEFLAVRDSAALAGRFVDLAALLGRYWKRTKAGEFKIAAEAEVIQVATAGAPRQLFAMRDGRAVPLDPQCEFRRGEVRAERFRLAPGEYSYRPADEAHSDLLRPMAVRWKFADADLPAGRPVKLVLEAEPVGGDQAALEGVGIFALVGEMPNHKILQANAVGGGRYETLLSLGPELGPFTACFGAEQHGWTFRVGRFSGRTVLPPPLNVELDPAAAESQPIEVQTRESEKVTTLPWEVACETYGRRVELLISSSHPDVQVEPARVELKSGRQRIDIQLSRHGAFLTDETVKVVEICLAFEVRAEDLALPTINTQPSAAWTVRWRHRRPAILVRGLAGGETHTIQRGGSLEIPVQVAGEDLDDGVGLQLSADGLPDGLSVGWSVADGPTVGTVQVPQAGSVSATLQICADKWVLPGGCTGKLSLTPTDASVPVNGELGPWQQELAIRVGPVGLVARIAGDGGPWTVTAPWQDARRTVQVEITAADGGRLPEVDVKVTADRPLVAAMAGKPQRTDTSLRVDYVLQIPAQSPPSEGAVRFTAVGDVTQPAATCEVPFMVRSEVVTATVEAVEIGTYVPCWLHEWFPRSAHSEVHVRLADATSPISWQVQASRPGAPWQVRRPDERGQYELYSDWQCRVALSSAYAYTQFVPARYVPLATRVVIIDPPPPVGLVLIAALAVALAWRYWPVRVLCDGVKRSRSRCLHLGRLVGQRQLKLRLTRRKLTRSGRDTSGVQVLVQSQELGRAALLPGDALAIRSGDTIELRLTGGVVHRVEVLSGRSSCSNSELDERPDTFCRSLAR